MKRGQIAHQTLYISLIVLALVTLTIVYLCCSGPAKCCGRKKKAEGAPAV